MNVISIDPGIHSTGIFVVKEGAGYSIVVQKPRGEENYDALVDVRRAILRHAKGADMALVEDYPYGLEAGRSAHAIEAGGVVRATLAEMGIPIVVIAIPTWKSLTIGNMKKDTVEQKRVYCATVLQKYGHGFVTVDECDAYLIYRAALRIWTEEIDTDAARRIRSEIEAAKLKSAAKTA